MNTSITYLIVSFILLLTPRIISLAMLLELGGRDEGFLK